MNVLCLGSRIIGSALAQELVDAFLDAQFESEQERHVRRHNKVEPSNKPHGLNTSRLTPVVPSF